MGRVTQDRNGMYMEAGDYVQRYYGTYGLDLVPIGGKRRIQRIDSCNRIKLFGPLSDSIASRYYNAEEFQLTGRHSSIAKNQPNYNQRESKMLHLAILVETDQNYQSVVNNINSKGLLANAVVMADITASALKERVKANITHHPDNRWLILSGNTIAEISAPPVSFRQW